MEKVVYCEIGVRRKRIKFISRENTPDVHTVKMHLMDLCAKDEHLSFMLKDQLIFFQQKDEYNQWYEIEDTDEMNDRSEIRVILTPDTQLCVSKLNDSIACSNEMKKQDVFSEKRPPSSTSFMPGPAVEPITVLCDNRVASTSAHVEEEEQQTGTQLQFDFIDTDHEVLSLEDIKPVVIANMGYTDVAKPSLTTLPKMPPDLQHLISAQGVLRNHRKLINFWGGYLFQETQGNPRRCDYATYSTLISQAYPSLNDRLVRSYLSNWIRNRKAALKKKGVDISLHPGKPRKMRGSQNRFS